MFTILPKIFWFFIDSIVFVIYEMSPRSTPRRLFSGTRLGPDSGGNGAQVLEPHGHPFRIKMSVLVLVKAQNCYSVLH